MSFAIEPGQIVGIVGRSGSGKTTITRLIQGLYRPQAGLVNIDGQDLKELDLAHLRTQIGVVLQENFLFRGTVRENIAMTKPAASLDEVVRAAQLAGAHEFIQRLPHGYSTMLEESAANLSGGQRQRLAIARALIHDPPVLVLDEATSSLDPESEAIIQQHLAAMARGRTIVIITPPALFRRARRCDHRRRPGPCGAGRHARCLARQLPALQAAVEPAGEGLPMSLVVDDRHGAAAQSRRHAVERRRRRAR